MSKFKSSKSARDKWPYSIKGIEHAKFIIFLKLTKRKETRMLKFTTALVFVCAHAYADTVGTYNPKETDVGKFDF